MNTATTNTLYLVRHGENQANLTKEFSYKLVDYSLTTPKGEEQARQTAEFFKNISLDVIYSSPLKRARETAEWIARPHHLPVTILEEFREVNIGDLEIASPTDEILRQNWKEHDRVTGEWFKNHPQEAFPGGENFLELRERSRQGLIKVISGRDNQRILISSHGGILSAIVKTFCQNAEKDIVSANMGNCAITEIELTTTGDRLSGFLRIWSSTTHLSGLAAEQVSPRPRSEVLLR